MSKRWYVFEGIVTPIRDYESDFLYIHKITRIDTNLKDTIEAIEKRKALGITDFFSKDEITDTTPCPPHIGNVGDSCNVEYCPFCKDGKCKPPMFKVRIIVEVEKVNSG